MFLFGGVPFSCSLQNLVLVSLVPLPLSLLDRFRISLRHTEHNWVLTRVFVYIYRAVRQSPLSVQVQCG